MPVFHSGGLSIFINQYIQSNVGSRRVLFCISISTVYMSGNVQKPFELVRSKHLCPEITRNWIPFFQTLSPGAARGRARGQRNHLPSQAPFGSSFRRRSDPFGHCRKDIYIPGPSWTGCFGRLTGGFWAPVVTRKHLLQGAGIYNFGRLHGAWNFCIHPSWMAVKSWRGGVHPAFPE